MPHPSPIRFAPSTTGYAHPGTLLSGLLCWLHARALGAPTILRLENLDPDRCRPEYHHAMIEDLAWFGLDWDERVTQSDRTPAHEAALDVLADRGLLYPCSCSRARIKTLGRPAPDGGFAYDNHCRQRRLPPGGWRACTEPVRLRLPDTRIQCADQGGLMLDQQPAMELGDPVVRRRDRAMAYHLAVVVDDADAGIREIIRGRDLAPAAPVQMLIHHLLDLPVPAYRHHFLLLEHHGGKLAKLHGAVDTQTLRRHFEPEALVGQIAHWAGLLEHPEPCRPSDLIANFSWTRIRVNDLTVTWDGRQLLAIS